MPRPQLAEFIKRMDANSIAIIPSAREVMRTNDTNYRYRQNSDFYYLTGFDEPESIAVISPSKEHKYTLFVRPRDPVKEQWEGHRAGVEGARNTHGADAAYPIEEFQSKLGELLTGATKLYYPIGAGDTELDARIIKEIAVLRALGRQGIVAPQAIVDVGVVLHEIRLIKNDVEIQIMQRAADIAAEAHIEAMKQTRPGMNEYEIEALIEYLFRKNGASAPAYNSIIGGGVNATILHYVCNDAPLHDGDLLLLDAGAEYKGYASDITRTFPVNGRFTQPQRDIYDLVLETEISCVNRARPGISLEELKTHSIELLTEGMVRLGLLQGDVKKLIEEGKYKQFYMHGIGHYLGMDVHDVGLYHMNDEPRKLEAGMIVTIEPGLYIAPNTENVPDKYLGIGVRIEDDVLITADGNRVLTSKVPKQAEEIEALMAR